MAEVAPSAAPAEAAKRAAGRAAAALVEDGMLLGLGTGSTARWFVEALGERVAHGLDVAGVPTSAATERLARAAGIPLVELADRSLDLAVDGADQVDPALAVVKGAGGALVRERIVAAAARRFVVIVDGGKLVERLRGPVPLEVLEFGWAATLRHLAALGRPSLRMDAGGRPLRSDNGNLLADLATGEIDDAAGLGAALDAVPGVVGHGLFAGMASALLVGHDDGGVDTVSAEAGAKG